MKKRIISLLIITVLLFCMSSTTLAADSTAIQSANKLYTLGLFRGTGTNSDGTPVFNLDVAATRFQAVTMLVRLLGKDTEAQTGNWSYPFIDVPDWAAPYVGYAYANSLTFGVDAKYFGGDTIVTASQYITFILRVLGYDSSADFDWNKAWELSNELGLTKGEYSEASEFLRSDIAIITESALSKKIKDTDIPLLAGLYQDGAVTLKNIASTGLAGLIEGGALTAAQASEKASPSVFYLEVFKNESDSKTNASGSGFFISKDGVAVTNYHVIEGTATAYATTIDGNKYKVNDILYYNIERDIAVLRISKTSTAGKTVVEFPYLNMESSGEIKNGDPIYAIGSPLGLQNTISDGIISNKNRVLKGDELSFIQISAAISSGSSGGVLLNEYGDAIGITSATLIYGQNINLAVPLDTILTLNLSTVGVPYAKVYENIKVNIKSGSVGYADCSSVPDFGIYFKVDTFSYEDKDSSVLYLYDIDALMLTNSYTEVINVYGILLEAWGFELTDYFYDNDNFLIFVYQNDAGEEVFFGPTISDNTLTLCVMIIK